MAVMQETDDFDVMLLALYAKVKRLEKEIEMVRMARRVMGGGITKTQAVAAVEAESNLTFASGLELGGDLDMADHDIDLGSTASYRYIYGPATCLKFHPTGEYLYIRNRADTGYGILIGSVCYFYRIFGDQTLNYFDTREAAGKSWIFRSGDTLTECARLVDKEFGISRAGDITLLDTKKLSTGLANDDYFTIEAVDNDTSTSVEVAKVLGASEPEFGISRAGDITMLADKKLVANESSELTISSGEITVTGFNNVVDTEGDAATDDLDKINGGVDGMIIVLRAAHSDRTVVVKNMSVPDGNIMCGEDFGLETKYDTIILQYYADESIWLRLARADNA